MANVRFINPVRSVHGELVKHSGIIFRQKYAHDENGRVIHEGKQECYQVVHPRDFEKTPPKGQEKVHFDLWTRACQRAALESKVDHARYAYWRERWTAQLTKPDLACPVDPKTGKRKSYYQFDCFVRVAILWELRGEIGS